jgi:UDP-glucose 4-epimerase
MERFTPGYAGATELREMLRIHFDGQPILVATLDGAHRDWTYAEDVAEGIELAWAAPGHLPQRVFILASGERYPVGRVLEAFRQHLPGLEYRVVPAAEANYPVDASGAGPIPSPRRAAEVLGWSPRTSFADGMREYLTWIAAHGPQ